jgi:heat shock protein HslJ
VAAALALVLAACGPDPVVDGVVLEQTEWKALGVAGLSPVVGREPTLAFALGAVTTSGSAGCNDYSWTYRSLPGGAISVAGLSQSDRTCAGRDAIVAQVEDRFLAALKSARRIDVVSGRLEISSAVGTLVFEQIAPSR